MLRPVTARERYEILDVLRGFALFGVLVANLNANFSVAHPRPGLGPLIAALDATASTLIAFFVGAKFISIFAFLFGFGFAIQADRAASREISIVPTYRRRLFWLLIFGLTHAVFLWWGDILASYAVGGFLLLACRRLTGDKLRALGWTLALAGLALLASRPWIVGRLDALNDPTSALRQASQEGLRRAAEVFASGNLLDIPEANVSLVGYLVFSGILPLHFLFSCGLFLLGYLAGRQGLLIRRHPEDSDRLRFWRNRGLLVGLVGNALWVLAPSWHLVSPRSAWILVASPLIALGVLAMSTFYVTSVTLIHRSPRWRFLVAPFAFVGRMALTNYLGQSVFFLVLLYGLGFGLSGILGPAFVLPLAIGIFAVQLALSRWWLSRFEQGPVEALWRRLTYGRATQG